MAKKTFRFDENEKSPADMYFDSKKPEPVPKDAPVQGDLDGTKAYNHYMANPDLIEKKDRRTQLLLKKSLYDGVKDLAEKNGTSVNDMFNIILEEYLRGK